MLQKIYDNYDILYYFSKYLNLNEKIILQSIFTNTNLIINFNFFDNSYIKKTLFDINSICTECLFEISSEESLYLSSLYKNFLYRGFNSDYDSDCDCDCDYENYYYNYDKYKNIYDSCRIRDENEFILSTFYPVSNRAFIEIMDKNNIIVDIKSIDCLFELDFENNIFTEIYDKINDIYIDGIENKTLNLFCKKCGVFGHSDENKNCILFNESYEKYIVKKEVNILINDLVKDIIEKDKEEKHQQEKLKKLCFCCKYNFFSKLCKNKMCKKCCNCNAHAKNNKNIKKILIK